MSIVSRFRLAAASALVLLSAPALADTIGIFDARGVFKEGQTLSGTLQIDLDTGLITLSTLEVSGVGKLSATVFQNYYTLPDAVPFADYLEGADPTGFDIPQLATGINAKTLVGFGGGTLMSDDTPGDYLTGEFYGHPGISRLTSGSLTLASTFISSDVPEPATWALFVGGFGLAGAAMRRRRYRCSLSSVRQPR